MARQVTIVLITLVALSTVSTPASAQQDEWQFSLIPYGWITGMSGTFGARGKVADVGRKESAYRSCYSVVTVVLAESGYLG